MTITCMRCQRRNRKDSRFCDYCGEPLGGTSSNELRHATVVFVDLVDSTRLSNLLDREDYSTLMTEYRKAVEQICANHGGYVLDRAGDGVAMSFEASEDNAELAVRAALAIIDAVQSLSSIPDIHLKVRVGAASGFLFVNTLAHGDFRKNMGATGTVLNLAARITATAEPGTVLISDATRRLAGRYFSYGNEQRHRFHGFDDTETLVWRVLNATAIKSRHEALQSLLPEGVLIGRSTDLSRAKEQWASAVGGSGRTLMVIGEAGIGKSKLLRALRAQSSHDNPTVLELHSTPGTTNTPLYSVGVMLRRSASIESFDNDITRRAQALDFLTSTIGVQRAARGVDQLARLFGIAGNESSETDANAATVRAATLSLLVRLILSMAEQRTVLLLCEDLHWADATTLEVLRRLTTQIGNHPILLAATSRYINESWALLTPTSLTLRLHPLDQSASRELIAQIARGDSIPDEVVDEIIRRADGVPLWIEEYTRSVLTPENHLAPAAPDGVGSIPVTLQASIQSRVDRLPDLKGLVQAASIIGRQLNIRDLEKLLALRTDDLDDKLALLVQHGFLTPIEHANTEVLQFSHALIHQAIYDSTLRSERHRLHARYAADLISQYGTVPDVLPDVIAHHLGAGQRFSEALEWLLVAVRSTATRAAYVETAAHCETALKLINRIPGDAQRRAIERQFRSQLALAHTATRGYTSVANDSPDGTPEMTLGESLPGGDDLSEIRRRASFHQVRCELKQVEEYCILGIRQAEVLHETAFLIEMLTVYGYNKIYQGHFKEGRELLERCLTLCEQHPEKAAARIFTQHPANTAWCEHAIVCWLQGDTLTAERSIRDALELADSIKNPFDQAYASCHAAQLRNLQRRFPEADAFANRCVTISQKHSFDTWLACGLMQGYIAKGSMNQCAESAQALAATLAAFHSVGALLNTPFFLWGLARSQLKLGNPSDARATTAEALRRIELTGEEWCACELLLLAADLTEDPAQRQSYRERAITKAESAGAWNLVLRALVAAGGRGTAAIQAALEGQHPYPDEPEWVMKCVREIAGNAESQSMS